MTTDVFRAIWNAWPAETPAAQLAGLAALLLLAGGIAADVALLARHRDERRRQESVKGVLLARPWPWRTAAPVLLAFALVNLAFTGALGMLAEGVGEPGRVFLAVAIIAQTLVFHGAGLAVIAYLARAGGGAWRDCLGLRSEGLWRQVRQGGFYYLAAVPPVLLSAWLYAAALKAAGYDIEPQPVVTLLADSRYPLWLQAYLGAVAVTVAPVVEEALFRALGLPLLARRVGFRAAALIVSLAFALLHAHVPSLVPLFVMALSFAMAFLQTGSLLTPAVMHALFNAVSLLTLLALGNGAAQ
ncbi:MAG: CPBP family intramembrane metalloprotease [Lentisphaerae bacterium]|nr:CPBP family intramembrane metalloprotease [Lentisphaerota bacterium]